MNEIILRLLTEAVGSSNIAVNELMSKHTTFKIGGAADILVSPESLSQLKTVMRIIKQFKVPYTIIGNGSNILVGDKGIRGVVIEISGKMNKCVVDGTKITAESGIKLGGLASAALNANLTGIEFASGIPGTFGGALYMNAGAYGGEMKDVVESVTYYDIESEKIFTIPVDECDYGYRKSVFTSGGKIILSAVLNLEQGDYSDIKQSMAELSKKRNDKQPIDKPSAGSTFKRPEGYFAGTLIQDAGLKGTKIGGAEVSEKHAGFIINSDGATAEDVKNLIEYVKGEVHKKFGVTLEPEVKFIGEF